MTTIDIHMPGDLVWMCIRTRVVVRTEQVEEHCRECGHTHTETIEHMGHRWELRHWRIERVAITSSGVWYYSGWHDLTPDLVFATEEEARARLAELQHGGAS